MSRTPPWRVRPLGVRPISGLPNFLVAKLCVPFLHGWQGCRGQQIQANGQSQKNSIEGCVAASEGRKIQERCRRRGRFSSSHSPCRKMLKPSRPSFLVFGEFLVFHACEELLVCLSFLPFFSRYFRGSVGVTNPCFFFGGLQTLVFFGGFSLAFPQKRTGIPDFVLPENR